jgi:hypothetical protein
MYKCLQSRKNYKLLSLALRNVVGTFLDSRRKIFVSWRIAFSIIPKYSNNVGIISLFKFDYWINSIHNPRYFLLCHLARLFVYSVGFDYLVETWSINLLSFVQLHQTFVVCILDDTLGRQYSRWRIRIFPAKSWFSVVITILISEGVWLTILSFA